MQFQQIEFSKVLNDDQVYDHMMSNYDRLGKDWIAHQWRWMNAVYLALKVQNGADSGLGGAFAE